MLANRASRLLVVEHPRNVQSVSQGQICLDNFGRFHSGTDVADQAWYVTQSQKTDTWRTRSCSEPSRSDVRVGSRWKASFWSHWYDSACFWIRGSHTQCRRLTSGPWRIVEQSTPCSLWSPGYNAQSLARIRKFVSWLLNVPPSVKVYLRDGSAYTLNYTTSLR